MKDAVGWGARCAVAPVLFLLIAGHLDGNPSLRMACLAAGVAGAAVASAVVARHVVRPLTGLQAMYVFVAGAGVLASGAQSIGRMEVLQDDVGHLKAAAIAFACMLAFLIGVALALQVVLQHRSNAVRWGTLATFVFTPGILVLANELYESWRQYETVEPALERIGWTGVAVLLSYGVSWTSLAMAAAPPRQLGLASAEPS